MTNLELDEQTAHRLDRLAAVRGQSAEGLIHEAIQQYVERQEKRVAFRQAALTAWAEYNASGLHATEQEANAWFAKLESGEDAEPPECHV